MKKKLLFLALLFALFGVGMAIRYVFLSNTSAEGRLQIMSSPNATVLVNGKPSGKTPYESSLATGDYTIKLVADEKEASSSGSWDGKVTIFKNTRTFVSREIGTNDLTSSGVILTVLPLSKEDEQEAQKPDTGRIEVESDPDGSIVYLDDEEQGIAPLVLSNISKGDHELSVSSPGFFRRSQKVKVTVGYKVIASYKLAIDPSHKKVEKQPEEATDSATLTTTPTPSSSVTPSESLKVTINQTSTGWLRVRSEPSTSASESAKVDPGDSFTVLEEKSGWYKIEYIKGKFGWVSSQYVTKS